MSCGSAPGRSNRHLGRDPPHPRGYGHRDGLPRDEGFYFLHGVQHWGLLLFLLGFKMVALSAQGTWIYQLLVLSFKLPEVALSLELVAVISVSYTHLTLPTKRIV